MWAQFWAQSLKPIKVGTNRWFEPPVAHSNALASCTIGMRQAGGSRQCTGYGLPDTRHCRRACQRVIETMSFFVYDARTALFVDAVKLPVARIGAARRARARAGRRARNSNESSTPGCRCTISRCA